ncbi:MAG: hypothetical protein R2709_10955 [Marmoricola sp.]
MTQGAREQAPAVGQSQAAGQESDTRSECDARSERGARSKWGGCWGVARRTRPAHFVSDARTALAQPLAADDPRHPGTRRCFCKSLLPQRQLPATKQLAAPINGSSAGSHGLGLLQEGATGRLVLTGDHTIALYACDGRQLLHRSLP